MSLEPTQVAGRERVGWWALLALSAACGEAAPASSDLGALPDPDAATARAAFVVESTPGVVYARALRRDSPTAEPEPLELTLDLFDPVDAPTPKPIVLILAGGAFAGRFSEPGPTVVYSEKAMQPFARYFVRRGFLVALVRYRLSEDWGPTPAAWPPCPEGVDPTWYRSFYPAIRDAKAAVRWVRAEAEAYGASVDHVAILGGSAGATIGTALALSDPDDFTRELSAQDPTLAETHLDQRADVQAVVAFWGFDVAVRALERFDGRSRFDATDAPIAIVQGRHDTTVPFEYATSLRDALNAASIPNELIDFDGGHAAWGATIEGRTLPEVALDFVRGHLDLPLERR